MTALVPYLGTAAVALVVATGLLWPWLDGPARGGVVAAATVALVTQTVAFWLLARYRTSGYAFMTVLAAGTALRFGVVVIAAVVVTRWPVAPVAPTLLSLAGFLFGLLLLEPPFLRRMQA
ncbi:MAG: hypothetical protein HY701_07510 [Gemmatimonadetes bacterium]|nr:hypothetical protein [Gemmatimonadota bacterium]